VTPHRRDRPVRIRRADGTLVELQPIWTPADHDDLVATLADAEAVPLHPLRPVPDPQDGTR